MANNGWTPLGKKVDLSREVQGVLPISSMDPSVQEDVTDGYNLGTNVDGLAVLEGKDPSNQLAFFRLKPGVGTSIAQNGNSLVITSTLLAGNTPGVMLTTSYDTNSDGIVDHAAMADAVTWGGITGKPSSYPPSTHTHAEGDIVDLTTDLAGKVPVTRMVTTSFSLEGGGPLSADLNLSLIGDIANPGPDMRYGTDPSGNLGWYPASVGAGDMTQDVYDKNHDGIVDLAAALITGALTTAMIADGAVTGVKIASHTIPGSALVPGAVASSLGYVPLNKAGDVASGPIVVSYLGPVRNANMYQGAHVLLQTSGAGASVPTLGFSCLTGGANAGSVALWYQGSKQDLQLEYDDGTGAHLLSSISVLSGAQLTAGSVPASALAPGAAVANLGYVPVNSNGGVYANANPLALQHDAGIGASSWSVAGLRVQTASGGGNRPQIGFYYPGYACSLYFEPTDLSMRFVDSGGTVRVLLDSGHGVAGAYLQPGAAIQNLGFTPINKAGDTSPLNAQYIFHNNVPLQASSYVQGNIVLYRDRAATNCRAGLAFYNDGQNGCYLYLDIDQKLKFIDNGGQNHVITST